MDKIEKEVFFLIINLTHQKGGVGKSTLTTNIAVNLGADILDLDSLQACVRWNYTRRSKGNIPLACIRAETDQEALKIINKYKRIGKTLVIDSGGYDSEMNRLAILASEILITPVSPSQIELFGLQDFIKILKESSQQVKYPIMTNVIINNADVRSRTEINKLKSFIKTNSKYLDCFMSVIHSRAYFRKAYELGLSVEELDPTSKASDEIRMFCKEIKVL